MRIIETDIYIKCDDLREEANKLYKSLGNKRGLNKEDYFYIEDMNKYLNKYETFKEHQIKQYIKDLNKYISIEPNKKD